MQLVTPPATESAGELPSPADSPRTDVPFAGQVVVELIELGERLARIETLLAAIGAAVADVADAQLFTSDVLREAGTLFKPIRNAIARAEARRH